MSMEFRMSNLEKDSHQESYVIVLVDLSNDFTSRVM